LTYGWMKNFWIVMKVRWVGWRLHDRNNSDRKYCLVISKITWHW
jgi:hypothetical protein